MQKKKGRRRRFDFDRCVVSFRFFFFPSWVGERQENNTFRE
jgi:hypothetical protein